MIEPPRTVTTPTPLMTGLTPRLAYRDDGDEAVRLCWWRPRRRQARTRRFEADGGVWFHDCSIIGSATVKMVAAAMRLPILILLRERRCSPKPPMTFS